MSEIKIGRPLKFGVPLIQKTFMLEKAVVDWIKNQPNQSEFVNKTLREKMESK